MGETDWYCVNEECGNFWALPTGENPGPCSGCGGEMEPVDPDDPDALRAELAAGWADEIRDNVRRFGVD